MNMRSSFWAALAFTLICSPLFAGQARADGMEEQPPGAASPKKHKSAPAKTKGRTAASKQTAKPAASANASKPTPAPKRPQGNTQPLSDFELGRYQYCGRDNDCVVAVNGCCDCANGGIEVAVNKERLEDFRKRFDCLYVQCGHKVANPPCSNGVVSCIEHKCNYFDDVQR